LPRSKKVASQGLTNLGSVVGFAALQQGAIGTETGKGDLRNGDAAEQKSCSAGVDETEIGCKIRAPSMSSPTAGSPKRKMNDSHRASRNEKFRIKVLTDAKLVV
jgi:hypothetical protein